MCGGEEEENDRSFKTKTLHWDTFFCKTFSSNAMTRMSWIRDAEEPKQISHVMKALP